VELQDKIMGKKGVDDTDEWSRLAEVRRKLDALSEEKKQIV
jgi:hypothetical protein